MEVNATSPGIPKILTYGTVVDCRIGANGKDPTTLNSPVRSDRAMADCWIGIVAMNPTTSGKGLILRNSTAINGCIGRAKAKNPGSITIRCIPTDDAICDDEIRAVMLYANPCTISLNDISTDRAMADCWIGIYEAADSSTMIVCNIIIDGTLEQSWI